VEYVNEGLETDGRERAETERRGQQPASRGDGGFFLNICGGKQERGRHMSGGGVSRKQIGGRRTKKNRRGHATDRGRDTQKEENRERTL